MNNLLLHSPDRERWPTVIDVAASQDPEEARIPISQYLWICKRHRWRILGFCAAVVITTVIISARLTPIFESTTTVDVDRQTPAGVVGQDAAASVMNDADQFLATQMRLVQSDGVLRPVDERFHLRQREGQGSAGSASGESAPVVLRRLRVTRPPNTYATLNQSLRVAAMALVASEVFRRNAARAQFLRWFSWFGFVLAVASVLAYYTSPGSIFWLFASPYPDVWGSFLSRNNFAQFLELVLPVSLWLGCTRGPTRYLWMSAVILACGLVSASRAGALVMILEAIVVFALAKPSSSRRMIPVFTLIVISFAAVAGGEVLLHRLRDADPFRDRREIFASSLAMIAGRPWTGYGLGNFATVYPEFAQFDPGAVVEHAHNEWLEWAVEGGWPYAVAWMLLAMATVRPAVRSIWGIGVPAIFVHALVDYPFARFGVVAWLFILVGALESMGSNNALPKGRPA